MEEENKYIPAFREVGIDTAGDTKVPPQDTQETPQPNLDMWNPLSSDQELSDIVLQVNDRINKEGVWWMSPDLMENVYKMGGVSQEQYNMYKEHQNSPVYKSLEDFAPAARRGAFRAIENLANVAYDIGKFVFTKNDEDIQKELGLPDDIKVFPVDWTHGPQHISSNIAQTTAQFLLPFLGLREAMGAGAMSAKQMLLADVAINSTAFKSDEQLTMGTLRILANHYGNENAKNMVEQLYGSENPTVRQEAARRITQAFEAIGFNMGASLVGKYAGKGVEVAKQWEISQKLGHYFSDRFGVMADNLITLATTDVEAPLAKVAKAAIGDRLIPSAAKQDVNLSFKGVSKDAVNIMEANIAPKVEGSMIADTAAQVDMMGANAAEGFVEGVPYASNVPRNLIDANTNEAIHTIQLDLNKSMRDNAITSVERITETLSKSAPEEAVKELRRVMGNAKTSTAAMSLTRAEILPELKTSIDILDNTITDIIKKNPDGDYQVIVGSDVFKMFAELVETENTLNSISGAMLNMAKANDPSAAIISSLQSSYQSFNKEAQVTANTLSILASNKEMYEKFINSAVTKKGYTFKQALKEFATHNGDVLALAKRNVDLWTDVGRESMMANMVSHPALYMKNLLQSFTMETMLFAAQTAEAAMLKAGTFLHPESSFVSNQYKAVTYGLTSKVAAIQDIKEYVAQAFKVMSTDPNGAKQFLELSSKFGVGNIDRYSYLIGKNESSSSLAITRLIANIEPTSIMDNVLLEHLALQQVASGTIFGGHRFSDMLTSTMHTIFNREYEFGRIAGQMATMNGITFEEQLQRLFKSEDSIRTIMKGVDQKAIEAIRESNKITKNYVDFMGALSAMKAVNTQSRTINNFIDLMGEPNSMYKGVGRFIAAIDNLAITKLMTPFARASATAPLVSLETLGLVQASRGSYLIPYGMEDGALLAVARNDAFERGSRALVGLGTLGAAMAYFGILGNEELASKVAIEDRGVTRDVRSRYLVNIGTMGYLFQRAADIVYIKRQQSRFPMLLSDPDEAKRFDTLWTSALTHTLMDESLMEDVSRQMQLSNGDITKMISGVVGNAAVMAVSPAGSFVRSAAGDEAYYKFDTEIERLYAKIKDYNYLANAMFPAMSPESMARDHFGNTLTERGARDEVSTFLSKYYNMADIGLESVDKDNLLHMYPELRKDVIRQWQYNVREMDIKEIVKQVHDSLPDYEQSDNGDVFLFYNEKKKRIRELLLTPLQAAYDVTIAEHEKALDEKVNRDLIKQNYIQRR